MKILFIGDIVGRVGRKAVAEFVPALRRKHKIDFVIANAENSAHGSGVTEEIIKELQEAKVDFFTNGDHAFKNKKDFGIYEKYPIIRPANFPPGVPGKGWDIVEIQGKKLLIINLIGRVFMHLDYDCPFRCFNEILANIDLQEKNVFAIIVDMHAEATSEKACFKHYIDGRASALLGTHTHVQTADTEITGKGLAFITDVGMAGYADGSLGLEKESLIETMLTQIKEPHVVPEKGRAIFNAVIVDLNEKTGKAKSIKPIKEYVEIK
jgi:2',3'-cyclic-nucleotide 2'-phosphodiesterase